MGLFIWDAFPCWGQSLRSTLCGRCWWLCLVPAVQHGKAMGWEGSGVCKRFADPGPSDVCSITFITMLLFQVIDLRVLPAHTANRSRVHLPTCPMDIPEAPCY